MGDNVVELIVQFGKDVSSGIDIVEEDEKLIFFDVLGLYMVSPQPVVQLFQGHHHVLHDSTLVNCQCKTCIYLLPGCHAYYIPCLTGDIPHELSQNPAQDPAPACHVNAAS